MLVVLILRALLVGARPRYIWPLVVYVVVMVARLVNTSWSPATTTALIRYLPGELLESAQMKHLLAAAADAYDLVIVDAPPITVVSDEIPLLQTIDGVLLVGRIDKNTRASARRFHSMDGARTNVSFKAGALAESADRVRDRTDLLEPESRVRGQAENLPVQALGGGQRAADPHAALSVGRLGVHRRRVVDGAPDAGCTQVLTQLVARFTSDHVQVIDVTLIRHRCDHA